MAPYGFIHDSLDVKVLVLYIMNRVAEPIDFSTLTDLSMCDGGVDYFIFSQVVSQLVESRHLVILEDERYAITEKGRTNGGIMESSLPIVIRRRCDKAVSELNARLRRDAQVSAQVVREGDRYRVDLHLADDAGALMQLSLAAPSETHGEQIVQHFLQNPEEVFHSVLSSLLRTSAEEES